MERGDGIATIGLLEPVVPTSPQICSNPWMIAPGNVVDLGTTNLSEHFLEVTLGGKWIALRLRGHDEPLLFKILGIRASANPGAAELGIEFVTGSAVVLEYPGRSRAYIEISTTGQTFLTCSMVDFAEVVSVERAAEGPYYDKVLVTLCGVTTPLLVPEGSYVAGQHVLARMCRSSADIYYLSLI